MSSNFDKNKLIKTLIFRLSRLIGVLLCIILHTFYLQCFSKIAMNQFYILYFIIQSKSQFLEIEESTEWGI